VPVFSPLVWLLSQPGSSKTSAILAFSCAAGGCFNGKAGEAIGGFATNVIVLARHSEDSRLPKLKEIQLLSQVLM
jgi:hypothetical protein